VEKDRAAIQFKITSYPRLAAICEQFKKDQPGSTSARFKFLDHHLNVLKLYKDGQAKIFPAGYPLNVNGEHVLSIDETGRLGNSLFQFLEDNALWNKIYNGCGAQAPNFVVLT